MFGFLLRRKAAKAALEATRPIMNLLQSYVGPGIPPGFWEDPYVLGYLTALSLHFSKLATRNKIKGVDRVYVVAETLAVLSNMDGVALMGRGTRFSEERNPEYLRGIQDAWVSFAYAYGVLEDEDTNPIVIASKAAAKADGQAGDREAIAGFIGASTFYAHVRAMVEEER